MLLVEFVVALRVIRARKAVVQGPVLLRGPARPLLVPKLAELLLHLVHLLLRLRGLLLLGHSVGLGLQRRHLSLRWLLTLVYLGLSLHHLLLFKITLLHSLKFLLLPHDHVLLVLAVVFDFLPPFRRDYDGRVLVQERRQLVVA